LVIKNIISGKWCQNSYIVHKGMSAVIIDPGEDFDSILKYVDDSNLYINAVLLTHGHFDHIASATDCSEKFDSKIYMNSGDLGLTRHANLYRFLFEGKKNIKSIHFVNELIDGSTLEYEGLTINVIHSPGHTSGSISLAIEDNLFVGDLIANNKIGRYDLPGGDSSQLEKSLSRIKNIKNIKWLYQGHGDVLNFDQLLQII